MTDQIQQQAADPRTPGETLARIAYERPDLRATIAANPSAYPELLTWLGAFGDPQVDAAIAARTSAPVAGAAAAPAAGAPGWSPQQQPGAEQAWNAQAQPAGQGWSAPQPQPGAAAWQSPGGGYSGAGEPGVVSYDSGAPERRSRRGLVVGGAVAAGVLVLGGGAWAAKTLIFDKIGGSDSPEAAVTKLVESATDKDILAMYGSLSPAEVSHIKAQYDSFVENAEGNDEYQSALDSYQAVLDAVTLDVTGLEVRSESIADGVAKVYLDAGSFSLDGDTDKIATEVADLVYEVSSSTLGSSMSGSFPLELPDKEETKADIKADLDESLPAKGDIADLDGQKAYVVAVEEEGSWYVSPYLTLAEYALESAGGTRGTLPAASAVKGFDSPTAAASGLVDATLAYVKSGNPQDLAVALPLAERRLAALYLPKHDGTDLAGLTVENGFAERSKDGAVAKVAFDGFTFSYSDQGQTANVTLDPTCVTLDVSGMGSGEICVDKAPLIKEMGMQDASLVALSEGGSWFLSPISSLVDSSTAMGNAMMKLQKEGKLDDQAWIEEQTTALMAYIQEQPGFAMLGALGGLPGMSGYGYEDGTGLEGLTDGSGLSDLPQGGDILGDSTDATSDAPLTDEEIADLFGENLSEEEIADVFGGEGQ